MPSRRPSKSPPPKVVLDPYSPSSSPNQPNQRHRDNQYESHHLLPPLLASTGSACSFFFVVLLCFGKFTRKRTTPSDSESKPPYRFSYSLLRRATSSFSARLGHGGFGTVFSGTLPSTHQPIAVKLMDSASLQGEREFHNELLFASRLRSPHVVSAIGFCSDGKRRRFLLVYELMQNGNMQDALLHKKCPELMDWKKRFAIIIEIAKGIHYLHSCDPPVIHGDIKPSNILLDRYLCAKIGDFGLARLKSESQFEVGILGVDNMGKMDNGLQLEENKRREEMNSSGGVGIDDNGSVIEETDNLNAGFDDGIIGVEQSPDGFVRIPILGTSPETNEPTMASPERALVASPSAEKFSTQCEKDIGGGGKKNGKGLKSKSVKDLWLKHDNEAAAASPNKKVKDYVMEWIGKDINKETPDSKWVGRSSSNGTKMGKGIEKKKSRKKLEWWALMDEEGNNNTMYLKKKEKRRPTRESWKEKSTQEFAKRKKKKKQNQRNGVHSDDGNVDDWWLGDDDDLYGDKKMRKNSSRNSRSSIDWWLDGLSGAGELWRARRSSYDSASGEIPKSGGITSTPSMRGTVCYVAPEYGYGEDISEKCDVYSFGVLLLVIISGRRPLQVTNSPSSEFQRANLLSWARHCARNGKLLDLVDDSIESLDKKQALLCITVALLCLLKSPARRPSMKEILGMLNGELEHPKLPVEYSPSPPSRFPFKSRQKGR